MVKISKIALKNLSVTISLLRNGALKNYMLHKILPLFCLHMQEKHVLCNDVFFLLKLSIFAKGISIQMSNKSTWGKRVFTNLEEESEC